MEEVPGIIRQVLDALVQLIQIVYTWTIGMIAQALSLNPTALPLWKSVLFIVLAVLVILLLVRLFWALLFSIRDVAWGAVIAVIIALIILYVPDRVVATVP